MLLLDAAQSRAAAIPRSHNYPGFVDGIRGTELIGSLREQAARYGVETLSDVAGSIETTARGFRVRGERLEMQGRTVLLATGARDIRPDILYAADAVRDGLLRYCPVCDGYEVIDQAIGVLVQDGAGVREAIYLHHFTARVTVFLCGADVMLTDQERAELAARGIVLAPEPVASVRMWDGRITVRHGPHDTACDAVYCALGMEVHSSLATALGAQADDNGYLLVDPHHRTTVPGLYAAGDVAQGLNQISVAAGGAATAASAIHVFLNSAGH